MSWEEMKKEISNMSDEELDKVIDFCEKTLEKLEDSGLVPDIESEPEKESEKQGSEDDEDFIF